MTYEWSPVHRFVLPVPGDDVIVLPLYVDARGQVEWTRRSLTLPKHTRASFGTYFGAFPAAVWCHETDVRTFRLDLSVEGQARITIIVTGVDGQQSVLARTETVDSHVGLEFALEDDAGQMWFDVETFGGPAALSDARISARRGAPVSAVLAITTYNRPADCLATLKRLTEESDARVESVVVVDQGNLRVREQAGFEGVSGRSTLPIHVIEQANLGGSGGFSRGMIEAGSGSASHVLLLDDDVRIEPESISRMLSLASHARSAAIIGAQMLSLVERTRLHTYGETVDRRTFTWTPVDSSLTALDVARANPRNTPSMSKFHRVDFNGWWMSLIPTSTIRRVGLSLPFFIKWDDTEYSLRAGAVGVSTVTLPGAAIWHLPWTVKDDGWDWQAYFQLRNRVVTALLYGARQRGFRMLAATFAQDINHILSMQYGSAALRLKALEDVLIGPDHLVDATREGPAALSSLLDRFGQLPRPATTPIGRTTQGVHVHAPRGFVGAVGRLLRVAVHQSRGQKTQDARVDHLSRHEAKWWSLGIRDGAVIASADGNAEFYFRRDRATAFVLLGKTVTARLKILMAWRRLERQYRAAVPELSSKSSWTDLVAGRSGAR